MSRGEYDHSVTIRRILKVNHAGEAGAVRIYQAQLLVSQFLHPSLVEFLSETLGHEIEHKELFRRAMDEGGRKARPCRALWLWGTGGWVLGIMTALAGRHFVWVCTEAVEETVHQHLEDQLVWLSGKDDDLADLISSIQDEELGHLNEARAHITKRGWASQILYRIISVATETVIWLSTQGESSKMHKTISRTGSANS